MHKPLGVLDGHLAGRAHLLGDSFTIADLNVAAIVMGTWMNKADFSPWKNTHAWLARCFGRPAAQKTMAMRSAS
jgi:glutathione S-transferase